MPARPKQNNLFNQASPADDILAAGLDEAGRGALAGPVVAAAVILPQVYDLPDLADSKKLSASKRALLEPLIRRCAMAWGIGVVWQRRIDEINILQASLEAMSKAAARLSIAPSLLLIDGNQRIPANILASCRASSFVPRQKTIIGGDATIPSISAASILAKTFRDRLMINLAKHWPGYGFECHKGYGVKTHLAAIRSLGPCLLHRRSFRGVDVARNQLELS